MTMLRTAVALVVLATLLSGCASAAPPGSAAPPLRAVTTVSPSPVAATATPTGGAGTHERGWVTTMRRQLAADPTVRRTLLGRTTSRGLVQCAVDLLGAADDGRTRYLWLGCEDDRTGPRAATLSGGAEGAVVRLAGPRNDRRVAGVRLPRQATLAADITRLFPSRIARLVRHGDLPTIPTAPQLLATARSLPADPPCRASDLAVRQTSPGGVGLGSWHLPLRLTATGPPCLLAAAALTVQAGPPSGPRARLAIDGTATDAVVVTPDHPVAMLLEVPDLACTSSSLMRVALVWSTPGAGSRAVSGGAAPSCYASGAAVSLTGR